PAHGRGRRSGAHRLPGAVRRRDEGAGAPEARQARERVRRPRGPSTDRDHLGRLVANTRPRLRVRAAYGQLRRGMERDQVSAPALQHGVHRVHRDARHPYLLRDGGVRLRAVPPAVQGRAVHGADRHHHPAQAGAARANLRVLRRHRLDGHVAALDHPALLRQRIQRVPAAAVLHAVAARARRGCHDRRGWSAAGTHLGHRPAVVPGDNRRGSLPHRLRVERLLRTAALHPRQARPSTNLRGHTAVQLHLLAAAAPHPGDGAAWHGPARPALLLLATVLHARYRDNGRREVTLGGREAAAAQLEDQAFSLGVNYWPRRKAMSWWREFDAAEVEDDLALIASLGMDLVRVFLLWDDWQPHPEDVSSRRL